MKSIVQDERRDANFYTKHRRGTYEQVGSDCVLSLYIVGQVLVSSFLFKTLM